MQETGTGSSNASTASTGEANAGATPCYYGNLQLPCSVVDELERLRGTCTPVQNLGDCPVVAVVNWPEDDSPTDPAPPATEGDRRSVAVLEAIASMRLRAIDVRISPTPVSVDSESMGLVGLPVWLWTDQTPATWGPNTESATAGNVSVTVTAQVERVEWAMGDGTVVVCTGPGTPFDPDVHSADDQSPDCGHVYERTSRDQLGGAYTVTATSHWVADWTDDDGDSGTINFELSTSEQIRIGEMQVLRTTSGN